MNTTKTRRYACGCIDCDARCECLGECAAARVALRCHTFDGYQAALDDHRRKGESILNQIFGAQSEGDMTEALKARLWDSYAAMVREWDAARPEWVR